MTEMLIKEMMEPGIILETIITEVNQSLL